jgi:hypothetical protein
MKPSLLKATLAITSLLGVAGSTSAETLQAHIPFDFLANGKAMPAGVYTIRPIASEPSILLFENEMTRTRAMVFARSFVEIRAKPQAPITFAAGLGDQMQIVGIATAQRSYELSMGFGRSPLKGAALALTTAK